jgi:hypothetical protein
MAKNQNKTNKNVAAEIQSSYAANMDSELSQTGYKEKELQPARKNLKR